MDIKIFLKISLILLYPKNAIFNISLFNFCNNYVKYYSILVNLSLLLSEMIGS